MLPQPNVFWVCRSLQLGCTLPKISLPTHRSGYYDRDLQANPLSTECMFHYKQVVASIVCQEGGSRSVDQGDIVRCT